METVKLSPAVTADELAPASENVQALPHRTDGKYHTQTKRALLPPAFRRRVLHRFFLLYRHRIGLLMGAHLAYVNSLPAYKRKYFHSPGAIIKMLYADGFFHADLHAGNLAVLPGPKVGFIDVGMVGRFDEKMKLNMLYYFHSLVNGAVESSVQYLMAMARIGKNGDLLGFKRSVADLFRRFLLRSSDGSTSFAQLILESLAIGGK